MLPASPVCQARLHSHVCAGPVGKAARQRVGRPGAARGPRTRGAGVAEGGVRKEAADTGPFALRRGLAPGAQRSRHSDVCFAKTRFATDAHDVAGGAWTHMGRSLSRADAVVTLGARAAAELTWESYLENALPRVTFVGSGMSRPFAGGHCTLLSVPSCCCSPAAWPGWSPQPSSCSLPRREMPPWPPGCMCSAARGPRAAGGRAEGG